MTEYVLRKENEDVVQGGFRRDMMLRLGVYATELDNYMKSNSIEVSSMASLLPSNDFVECVTK